MPIRPYDQNQQFLLPPSLNEWVSQDHPVRIFSDIINHLDISDFKEIKREGRPSYDPRMMLKILLWSYATGIRSSRKIEERVSSDTVFMWLAGLERPDFRTICLFRRSNLEQVHYIFKEVLDLAKTLGLIRLGLIALDGTKVRANVSVDSFKRIEDWPAEVRRILAEAEVADATEDTKYGVNNSGNEIPRELSDAEIRAKKIAAIVKQNQASPRGNKNISMTDPDAKFMHHKNGSMPSFNCELGVTEDQIIVHSDVTNEPMDTNQLSPALDAIEGNCAQKPDQVVADAGFNSGQNYRALEQKGIDGYIPDSAEEHIGQDMRVETGLYTKDHFNYDEQKDRYVCPAGEALWPKSRTHLRTKYNDKKMTIYATRGKCLECLHKDKCIKEGNEVGRTVRRGEFEAERLRMRDKIQTPEGRQLYKKRKIMVEPVIGQIKTVGNFIRFMLRGLIGAKTEWKWATIAHNLLKITRKIVNGKRKMEPITA